MSASANDDYSLVNDNHSPSLVSKPHWIAFVKSLFRALPVAVVIAGLCALLGGVYHLSMLGLSSLPLAPLLRAFWLWQNDYAEFRNGRMYRRKDPFGYRVVAKNYSWVDWHYRQSWLGQCLDYGDLVIGSGENAERIPCRGHFSELRNFLENGGTSSQAHTQTQGQNGGCLTYLIVLVLLIGVPTLYILNNLRRPSLIRGTTPGIVPASQVSDFPFNRQRPLYSATESSNSSPDPSILTSNPGAELLSQSLTVPVLHPCFELMQDNYSINGLLGWVPGKTPRPAVYLGNGHMLLGISSGADVRSYSSMRQHLTIPNDANRIVLSFKYFPHTNDINGGDWFQALILDTNLKPLVAILKFASDTRGANAQDWTYIKEYDVAGLAERSVYVYFNVINDGDGLPSYMDVKDVSVSVCR